MTGLLNVIKNKAFKETCNLGHIYKNKLGKSSFAHDATYANSKDLAKITVSNQVLKNKAYKIALNLQYDECQIGLASIVCKFL